MQEGKPVLSYESPRNRAESTQWQQARRLVRMTGIFSLGLGMCCSLPAIGFFSESTVGWTLWSAIAAMVVAGHQLAFFACGFFYIVASAQMSIPNLTWEHRVIFAARLQTGFILALLLMLGATFLHEAGSYGLLDAVQNLGGMWFGVLFEILIVLGLKDMVEHVRRANETQEPERNTYMPSGSSPPTFEAPAGPDKDPR